MSPTPEQIATLRRRVAEPTEATYTNYDLQQAIARYPIDDDNGQPPYFGTNWGSPPTRRENPSWIPTYDLAAAAAEVWEEKAASAGDQFDFGEDGQTFKRSQKFEQAMKQARYWRARRRVQSVSLLATPETRTIESNEC